MDAVDLCGRESGSIWTKKPVPSHKDGYLLRISNTRVGLTAKGRRLQFVKTAFGCDGGWFVAADQLGVICHFSIHKNRYQVVHRTGQPCTAITCSPSHSSVILLALTDGSIRCLDIDSGLVVATLKAHTSSVKSLSVHSSGQYLLSVSSIDAILWELKDTYSHMRTLNGGETVGVQDVLFVPHSNTILTCFRDNSIHGWETDTQEYKYILPLPSGPAPHYRTFATTQTGDTMAAAGRSCVLHAWNMEDRRLLLVLQLPAKILQTKQLLFVPNSNDGSGREVLGLLAQDGILRMISLHHSKVLFQLGSDIQFIDQAQVDPTGRIVVSISNQGDLLLYDITVLLSQHTEGLTQDVSDAHKRGQKLSSSLKVSSLSSSPRKTKGKGKVTGPRKPKLTGGAAVNSYSGISKGAPSAPDIDSKKALSADKLRSLLKAHGEYPSKYRSLIWQWLLRLPGNHTAYGSLLEKGTHSAYADLHVKYPIKSRKLLRVLQRALSVLAHWSPLCAELDYIPGLVFPFVKLFQNNQLVTFELLATLLMNWFSHWFEYFPNPPLNVLSMVENLLAHSDPTLLKHFVKHKVTSQLYVWPLLQTVFSEVLTRDEWLKLWDNILTNHPSFLLVSVAAYLTTARQALLHCSSPEDIQWFLTHHNSVNINTVIQEAYRIWETTPTKLHPGQLLEGFTPLTSDTYPAFNKYPKFIVDYQVVERKKLQQEEREYLRQRQSALEMERLTEQRRHEDEAWYRQQELLLEAERQRRKMMEKEEHKLKDQQARLQAMKREARITELKALDEARRRYLHHQQTLKENEVAQLDKEIQKKIVQRDEETQAAIEDIELRTLELQAQRALLEQDLRKRHDEAMYQLKANHKARVHREDVQQELLHRGVEEEVEREGVRVREAQARLAMVQAVRGECEMNNDGQLPDDLLELHGKIAEHQLSMRHQEELGESKILQHTLTDAQNMELQGIEEQGLSPGLQALQWSKRRHQLDNQEAKLLSNVHNLRRKVAQQMIQSSSSFSSSSN